jgi:SAM-dependent methyltransferase
MDLGFRGEVVDFYHRFRRGYPPAVVDALVAAFELSTDDVVIDLGCGTGQLTVPVAERVRAVVGVDPEPDMLARAREAAGERNVSWAIGSDADLVTPGSGLRALLGEGSCGAVTVAQALHWMDHERLFAAVPTLVRPGGGIAVVTNGRPLWQQDTAWSRALLGVLEESSGTRLTRTCGTDDESQRRYAADMTAAGLTVRTDHVDYDDTLDVPGIIGGVYSAMSADQVRPGLDQRIRTALAPHGPYTEHVRVTVLSGRTPSARHPIGGTRQNSQG